MVSSDDIKFFARTMPPEFINVAAAASSTAAFGFNIIGVVGDWQPPTQTRGTDFQVTFVIFDDSIYSAGLRVKVFRPDLKELPQIKSKGDVILIRNLRMNTFHGSHIALASWGTSWIVFPKDSIPGATFRVTCAEVGTYLRYVSSSGAPFPSIHEQQYVITLNDRFKNNPTWQYQTTSTNTDYSSRPPNPEVLATPSRQPTGPSNSTALGHSGSLLTPVPPSIRSTSNASTHTPLGPSSISPPRFKNLPTSIPPSLSRKSEFTGFNEPLSRKFSLIKDVEPDKFYDLAVEVVKQHWGDFEILECYVTDFTANSSMYNQQEDEDLNAQSPSWARIVGRHLILKIELHQPHASWASQKVQVGDLVMLTNVRVKIARSGYLEGNLWEDKFHPDKICAYNLPKSHPAFHQLVSRKEAYLSTAKAQPGGEKRASKSKKKKRNAAKNSEQQENSANKSDTEMVDAEPSREDASVVESEAAANKLNKNITTTCPEEIGLSTFDHLLNNPARLISHNNKQLELPFINAKYRVHLRVLDFFPHRLRDLSVPTDDSKTTWMWDFWVVLCAGDSNETPINVEVSGEDAEQLLGMPASDLRKDKDKLNRLRYVLSLLWGSLEEEKDKFIQAHPRIAPDEDFSAITYNIAPDNLPFEGCIRESGTRVTHDEEIEVGGVKGKAWSWERIYSLFGTKINA